MADDQPQDLPYPELLDTLRKEFGDKGPYTDQTLAAIDARLKELQPHRTLYVLTRDKAYLVGIGEGALKPETSAPTKPAED